MNPTSRQYRAAASYSHSFDSPTCSKHILSCACQSDMMKSHVALLRHQSLRMAATQSAAAKLHQSQAVKTLPFSSAASSEHNDKLSSSSSSSCGELYSSSSSTQRWGDNMAPKPSSCQSCLKACKIPENISPLGQLRGGKTWSVSATETSYIRRLAPRCLPKYNYWFIILGNLTVF